VIDFVEYEPGGGLPRIAVTVRSANADDVAEIIRVQRSAGRREQDEDAFRHAISDADRLLVVAEPVDASGATFVVGWAKTHHHTVVVDEAPAGHYLGGVTVDPAWRRRGVAAALTEARMSWIAARADEAFYIVNVRNPASIDLHRRWGFEEVLRAPGLMGGQFTGGVGLLLRAPLRG